MTVGGNTIGRATSACTPDFAADAVRAHGGCEIVCTVSLAVRVCVAARDAGIDLSGTAFYGGGEHGYTDYPTVEQPALK